MEKEEATNGGQSEKCKNENKHYVTNTKWGKCEEKGSNSSEVTYVCLSCFSINVFPQETTGTNKFRYIFFFLSAFNSAMEEIRQLKTIFLLKVCSVVTF